MKRLTLKLDRTDRVSARRIISARRDRSRVRLPIPPSDEPVQPDHKFLRLCLAMQRTDELSRLVVNAKAQRARERRRDEGDLDAGTLGRRGKLGVFLGEG